MNGFLGVDVSKGYADFYLQNENFEQTCGGFRLQDNKNGYENLKNVLEACLSSHFDKVFIGLESTGGYENNWYYFLRSLSKTLSIKVVRLNPKAVKNCGNAKMVRSINDQVSACLISDYLIRYPDKVRYAEHEEQSLDQFKEGRGMYNFLQMQIKQRVQLNNQLEKILYSNFSVLLTYCRHGIPGWLLRVLAKYQSSEQVLRAGVNRLMSIKGVSKSKAEALVNKSEEMSRKTSKTACLTIKGIVDELIHKDKKITQYKKILIDLYKSDSNVGLLTSMPGIGDETAVLLILEIEDVSRFESTKNICSYFGVHPTMKHSGDGQWKSQMSKKGRGAIRARLYMVGMTAIRKIDSIKQLYHRMRKNNMNHYAAMGVVMHKLLRMIYGMLKSEQPFNEITDINNQSRLQFLKQEEASKENPLYRYQKEELDAPISRRQEKKRREQLTTQLRKT